MNSTPSNSLRPDRLRQTPKRAARFFPARASPSITTLKTPPPYRVLRRNDSRSFAASATRSDSICETFPPDKNYRRASRNACSSTPRLAQHPASVNHHGGQTANTMLGSAARHLTLMHVMNVNLVLRPC
jgi:hypothetical protein